MGKLTDEKNLHKLYSDPTSPILYSCLISFFHTFRKSKYLMHSYSIALIDPQGFVSYGEFFSFRIALST